MKTIFNCKWFKESNRYKHFLLGIPCGILTILFGLGIATGMEVKDCQSDKYNSDKPIYKWRWDNWDWLDWICTVAGSLIGNLILIGIILLIC